MSYFMVWYIGDGEYLQVDDLSNGYWFVCLSELFSLHLSLTKSTPAE